MLRRWLLGENTPWTVLGQSFGGFCALAYLVLAPSGLREVLITGGLPALIGGPDPVYAATYRAVAARTGEYFARYPDDQEQAARILNHLDINDERLPTGERLTPQRFQTIGITLGSEPGFHNLRYLLEDPFVFTLYGARLSDSFLSGVSRIVSFAERPLNAVLHEPIYCQQQASRWSAHRLRPAEPPNGEPWFTGEMIYPWQVTEDPALASLEEVAHHLATKDNWPYLYDTEILATNQVPAAPAVYLNDMFVPAELSMKTANAINSLRPWVTNTLRARRDSHRWRHHHRTSTKTRPGSDMNSSTAYSFHRQSSHGDAWVTIISPDWRIFLTRRHNPGDCSIPAADRSGVSWQVGATPPPTKDRS